MDYVVTYWISVGTGIGLFLGLIYARAWLDIAIEKMKGEEHEGN